MSSSRRRRRAVAQPVRTVACLAARYLTEALESRVLLASALYEPPPAVRYGAEPRVYQREAATALFVPDGGGTMAPDAVNGVVHSAMTGSFSNVSATGNVIAAEDYDSINDATINLSFFRFRGGVGAANGTMFFDFFDLANNYAGGFSVTFPNNAIGTWNITPPPSFTVPDAGYLQVEANTGVTGTWQTSTSAPTVGTQNPNLPFPSASNFKFELTNTIPNSPPVITSLSDSPDPVVSGSPLTLTANGVSDVDGNLTGVSFYRESNLIAGLQTGAGGDLLVGTDNTGPSYSVTITAPANGQYTYYAQATDSIPALSNVVSTTNLTGIGSITGTVWNDANNNTLFDGGEPGLANWTVFLDTDRDQVLDGGEVSTTTNASGVYTFSNLVPDTYWVTTVIPAGWTQTFPGVSGQISAAVMGSVSANAVATQDDRGLPDGVTTTASDAPVYLPDGTSPVGGAQPYALPNMFTEDIESNPLIRLTNFQADPRFSTIRGQGSAVAVLDTGIDRDSTAFGPDLVAPFGVSDRIVYQQDFANGDMDATDFNGHGSNVASIVGSQNGAYPGMAPDVNIIALKVFTDAGAGQFSYTEAALQWVVANAATYNIVAINMSLGDNANYNTNQALYGLNDELAALAAMNVMVVSAAGNSYFNFQAQGVAYPAADANSLGVGAVYDANVGSRSYASGAIDNSTGPDRITSFSQRSATHTEIFAPGGIILGANTSGGTVDLAGTSQAAPHIAGIAALAQQIAQQEISRRLTMTEFKTLMQNSGISILDGDDEADNVPNTGLTFKRVDVLSLGEAIRAMAKKPNSHTVTISPGEAATNVNFGNKSSDVTAPTADIVDVTPDPRQSAVGLVTINFTENVTGVDKSDFTLTRDGASVSLTAATFAAVNGSQYTLDLTGVTSPAGLYVLTLNPGAANNIEDQSGNDFVTPANDSWLKTAVDGTSGPDVIELTRSGAVVNVFINNITATPTYTINIANLGANVLSVLGGSNSDSIEIDFSGGTPSGASGLSIDGGAGGADKLTLSGTIASEMATFTTTNFNFGALTISHTNVEGHFFQGGATNTDTLNINSGDYTFAQDANVHTQSLNLVVAAAGTVHFNTTQHINSLTLAGNAEFTTFPALQKYLVTKSLSITGAGKLDLRTNDLILNYTGSSPLGVATGGNYTAGSVLRMVQTGSNAGAWDGVGVMTSDPNAAGGLTALGVGEASDVFGLGPTDTGTYETETIDGTTIIVKYTYAGDANLDGFISGDDYAAIDFNIAVPNSSGWYNGDFNYDGIISGDDYAAIDFNIVAQGTPL